ncbi:MAG: hypothetical protein KC933_40255 [Myxococcales bacterium]|nr:hypothetical protein [Myxococcales bacterium]MCB9646370.1 hypothetical protein [Deltaproteobacteria bacterium]
MRPAEVCAIALALAAPTLACDPIEEFQQAPFVQKSAEAEPRWTVDINRVQDGVFAAYRPHCFEIRKGHTVEFRNFLPEIATNVTGLEGGPAALYSPNLVRPYQYRGPDDPENPLCDAVEGGVCVSRPPFSYWRYTFELAGTYDWLDTNQGSPGRKVVDPYYGTETFIGIDPNSPLGTICVVEDDGTGCEGVCCATDSDCSGKTRCFKSEFDAVGRCLTP